MKKLFLFVMIILPSMMVAQTVSNLQVIPGATGSPGTVTFDVEWDRADLNLKTLWLDSIWVFVDYNKNGKMERLLISGGTLTEHTATKTGTGIFIEEPNNDKGAWVYGDARTNAAGSFSAKVQLYTKETDIIIAGACAYASSYPPVSNWLSDVKLGFAGTPMYEITLTPSGGGATITVEAGDSFLLPCSYTMSSFTDATGAPGIINCMPPTALTLATPYTTVCAGETITLTASANGAASYSINGTDWQPEAVFEVSPTSDESYTLYAKTAEGCVTSATEAAVLTVNPLPNKPTMSGEGTHCTGSANITATAGANGILWDDGSTSPSRNVTATCTYYAVAVSTAGCTSSTATVTVAVGTPSASGSAPDAACNCASGLINCSGICQSSSSGMASWTTCSGFTYVSDVSAENCTWMSHSDAVTLCSSKGMRLPTVDELKCMCTNKSSLPGAYASGLGQYWSSSTYMEDYIYLAVYFGGSNTCTTSYQFALAYVKCVKN